MHPRTLINVLDHKCIITQLARGRPGTQTKVSPTLRYLVNGRIKTKEQVASGILGDDSYAKRMLFTFINLFTFCLLLCL